MIAVIGATGFTAHRIVHMLRQVHPDEELIAVVRPSSQRRRLAGLRVTCRIADVRHTRDLTGALAGCRRVVCAASLGFGDAPSICAALAAESRDHAVLFSTTAIFSQVPSASRATRIAAEEALRTASFPATLVRPTMIYGRPGDRNIERLLRFLGRSRWAPTVDSGRALQQPVHATIWRRRLLPSSIEPTRSAARSTSLVRRRCRSRTWCRSVPALSAGACGCSRFPWDRH